MDGWQTLGKLDPYPHCIDFTNALSSEKYLRYVEKIEDDPESKDTSETYPLGIF